MNLISFLVDILKVVGLIFLIGIVVELIVSVLIVTPIKTIIGYKKKSRLLDILMEKVANGEDLTNDDVQELEEKIEN